MSQPFYDSMTEGEFRRDLLTILSNIFNALDSIDNTLHDILLIKEQEVSK